MPIVTGTFTPIASPSTPVAGGIGVETAILPDDLVKQLQNELSAVGLPVTGTEAGATPQIGQVTSAQLKIFQDRYTLPVTGDLDATTGGILAVTALVATETDRAKLRSELAKMVNAVPGSSDYNYWV